MKRIINLFNSSLISLGEANEMLSSRGYELRDTYVRGKFFLYPLNDRSMH